MKSLLVDDLMREWQARRGPVMTARTRATNVAPVNTICEMLGHLHAAQLDMGRVETFRNCLLERGMSKLTAARYLSTLRAGLGDVGEHLNIGKLISELKRGPNKIECWTKAEARKIIIAAKAADGVRLAYFIELLFATGMRRGEALALRSEDFDRDRMRLHIHRSLTLEGNVQDGTKWGGERYFPVGSGALSAILDDLGPNSLFLPFLDQRTVGRKFKTICCMAGVPGHKMHCTRHSAISWALAAGMSLRKASEIFGVSQGTLEKHYAHYVQEEVNMDWAEL